MNDEWQLRLMGLVMWPRNSEKEHDLENGSKLRNILLFNAIVTQRTLSCGNLE